MVATAHCGQDEANVPLDVLTSHLTFGFDDLRDLRRQDVQLSGRAAVLTEGHARLDNKSVSLVLVVLAANHCVFDLQLVGTADEVAARRADFDHFYQGFSVLGRS